MIRYTRDHFYESIQGFFNIGTKSLYEEMVRNAKNESHFVEVGCFKGRSSSFLAIEIINSLKHIKLDCVDHWEGSPEFEKLGISSNNLYNEFLSNMQPVIQFINPIVSDSAEAAKNYKDKSLDFVFIDAGHEYEDVKKDIEAYLPKIKPGGILAGDDLQIVSVEKAVIDLLKEYKTQKFCWVFKVT